MKKGSVVFHNRYGKGTIVREAFVPGAFLVQFETMKPNDAKVIRAAELRNAPVNFRKVGGYR